ncbi:hypothetical protein C6A85_000000106755, partial [Mycobacterium sp. ITM-2017-0098]
MYPDGHQPIDAITGYPADLQNEGVPAGWRGWRSAFVELGDVEALQLQRDEHRVGTVRLVRKDARPKFLLDEPTQGLRSADGRDVYGRRPEVRLPASHSDSPPSWRVRTRRLGSSEWIVDDSWDAEDVEVALDPFDDDEEPQLGLFEIIVTGPLGADARLVIFLAEDLWVEFDTAIRIPHGGGLTACTAEVDAHLLEVKPSGMIRFEEHQVDKAIDVTNSCHVERLFVVPPCIEVRSGEVGTPAPWRVTAPLASPEDLRLDRFAALRAPGLELEEFVFIDGSGNVIQIGTQPRRRPGNVYEVKTQQFADCARMQQSGRIMARLKDKLGTIEVAVVSIQPKRLGSEVTLHDGILNFGDIGVAGLSVYVWCATAPWLPPDVFPLIDGQVKLPERLLTAGELRCQLFVDDPWVVVEPPSHQPRDVLRVEQDGWYESGTEVQNDLSRFLAGGYGLPASVGAVPETWTALAQVHAEERKDRIEYLVPVLIKEPRTSLESLGNSSIPLRDRMAMLILSELVNRSFAAESTFNALHPDPWFGCMTELSDLPRLFHRRDKVADERAETIGYLVDRGGPSLTSLLRTGSLSAFTDACFDETIFAMASAPVAEVIQTVRDRARLPRPLLDRERR